MQDLSWSALLALMLAMFAISVGYSIVLPVLPFLIERLAETADGVTLSWHTGLLTGIYVLAIFLFAPVWGKVSDLRARKPVILLGLTGFAITFTLFALFESLPLLYLGRFLDGVFAAAIAPATYALVGNHAPSREWRAYRFTLLNVAATAGFFVGPLIGGLVLRMSLGTAFGGPEVSFVVPFVAASGLALLAALMTWGLVSEAQRRITEAAMTERADKRAIMLRLCAIAFVSTLAIGAFEVGVSLLGKQSLGMDAYQIGMVFAECSIVMFIVQVLVFSPLIKPEFTRWFLTPGLLVLALGLALVPLVTGYLAMTITVALVAASAGILPPIVTYWVSLKAGETEGAEQGRLTAAASLGQAVGSAGGGMLFNVSLIASATFIGAAIVVLTGLAASLGLPRLLVPHQHPGNAGIPAKGHRPSEDGRI